MIQVSRAHVERRSAGEVLGRHRADVWIGAVLVAAIVLRHLSTSRVLDNVLYLGVLTGAGVLAWIGAERLPVRHRLVGRLIVAGLMLTALGDATWVALQAAGRDTDVSIADPAWFSAYVVLCLALTIVLRRSGAGRQDLDFTLDAATIIVVSLLALWSLSIDAIVAESDISLLTRAVWASYPVADAILLALVVRVLTSRVARRALDPSFAVGAVLWLAADLAYLGSPGTGEKSVMDVAWMVAPVLLARSVWHLSSPREVPVVGPPHGRPVPQAALAVAPLLVPPLLELVSHLRGEQHTPYALAAGATLLTVLAFARVARLVRSEERARRELEQARDDALEAYRAKSMFLATMSHEIRTPLTMVLGASELLDDTRLDDFQRDLVRRVHRSGTVLRSLVDVVLDYSRLEAGQLEVRSVPVDLRRLVDTLHTTYAPCAESRGVRMECTVDPGLPDEVLGDPERLLQVLGNLVDNAARFTPAGRIGLSVRATADGTMVEYVVEDTGIGIPEEHLASVFESFTQVDPSTTRSHGGIGLGLAICRQLTDLMGGTLGVTSHLGAGSTFVVRLPLDAVATPVERTGRHRVGAGLTSG